MGCAASMATQAEHLFAQFEFEIPYPGCCAGQKMVACPFHYRY
nr:F100 [uncultured bacterium]